MRYKGILNRKNEVVLEHDLVKWSNWFDDDNNRIIEKTNIGNAKVSTVFLAINHSGGIGPDLWFETVVFGGKNDGEMHRYETYDQAVEGHKRVVASLL